MPSGDHRVIDGSMDKGKAPMGAWGTCAILDDEF
jgi:hypothetical protein